MQTGDTIVAISSAVGAAPRMIVRLSGPDAFTLLAHVSDDAISSTGVAAVRLRFRSVRDLPATIYRFVAPHSVTGEHVVEFHVPGNAWIVRQLTEELIAHGARQAEPGEFTARAYFNAKLDLAEAEGVAAIVSARSEAELAAARKLMSGELSRRLAPPMDELADTLGLIEAGIDFSDEPVSFLSSADVTARCDSIARALRGLLEDSPRFERMAHEPHVVLAGRPNAGKSTLLNALAGFDRAVVSPDAGTTRDAIGAIVHLRRGLVRVIDVAGLDRVVANNPIDAQMQDVSRRAIETADVVVMLIDPTDSAPPPALDRAIDLTVFTKADLTHGSGAPNVSAHNGIGMAELRERLDELCFGQSAGASEHVALTARHVRSIEAALQAVGRASASMDSGPEIVALELRDALDSFGEVRGAISSDDVLGRVFARFCIGK